MKQYSATDVTGNYTKAQIALTAIQNKKINSKEVKHLCVNSQQRQTTNAACGTHSYYYYFFNTLVSKDPEG